jgi:hypothetical protein
VSFDHFAREIQAEPQPGVVVDRARAPEALEDLAGDLGRYPGAMVTDFDVGGGLLRLHADVDRPASAILSALDIR